MKKFFGLFIAAMTMLSVTSCSEEDSENFLIWDISPAHLEIYLSDNNGNNLLDPEVEGNWVDKAILLYDKNEEYNVWWNTEELPKLSSRMIPAIPYGLIWSEALYRGTVDDYYLLFGEFNGEDNHKMTLTLNLPGVDTEYEFEYVYINNWKNNRPHISQYIIFNGNKLEGNKITLTVPRNTDK